MTWESADKVQKNSAGEYRAFIGGEWVPVAKAQKNAAGEYRVERAANMPTPPSSENGTTRIPSVIAPILPSADTLRTVGNVGAGFLRGAGSIGATAMRILPNALGGDTAEENEIRRRKIDEGLREMGADTGSLAYSGGKLAGEIAGTAGGGGAIARGVMAGSRFAPTFAPKMAAAIRSGGLSTGAPAARGGAFSLQGVGNAATRIGGGAISGAAMATAINPEDAVTGAAIGAAFPVVGKLAGESGSLLREYAINPLFKPSKSAMEKLIQDAGGVEAARIAIDRAIKSGKTLSGESYTLGQAGKNEGIAATERARYAVSPENYQPIYHAQRDARIAAMQKIAGGADDVTRADSLAALKDARSEATEGLYSSMQDVPFNLGKEGEQLIDRAGAFGAVSQAQKLARAEGRKFSIPVVEEIPTSAVSLDDLSRMNASRPTHPDFVYGSAVELPTLQNKNLLSEIRKLGGVSMKDAKDLLGERQITKMGVQGGVFTKKGEEVGDMVRRLVDRGVMNPQVLDDVDGGAQALRDAIQDAAMGYSDDMAFRAAFESHYGPEILPGAFKEGVRAAPVSVPSEIVDRVVKGGDLQAVKMGIDQVIANAKGPEKRVMMQLKNDYLKFMETKSPEYIKANSIFSDMSKPITEMSVAQRMVDALTGEAYKHGAEAPIATTRFLEAYKNAPLAARSVSGMAQPIENIFTPNNLSTVKRVAQEVAAHGDLERLGRGVGSDTAQKIARSNMARSLADLVNSSPTGRAGINLLTLGSKSRVNAQLDAMLRSPEYAGKAFHELTLPQKNRLAFLMSNPVTRAGAISYQSGQSK